MEQKQLDPKTIFDIGLQYHHYANTAYPLTPGSFKAYRIKDRAKHIDFLTDEWAKADRMSLYVHVPFCAVRCKFCEYVVLDHSDETIEDHYVDLLMKEIALYSKIVKDKPIVGYDLGGGTPTKLSVKNLQKITDKLNETFNIQDDVIYSIETTPIIAAKEPEKIDAVYKMGYKRISMGVQTVSENLLNQLGREGSTHIYEQAVANIRQSGFEMFNIDLMYGFLHQSDDDFEHTLKYAIGLKPEYITLYRNRYKGTKLESEAGGVSLYKAITQYRLAYQLLTENGYMATPGKNTFSRIEGDYGASDYLTKRVIEGVPYVGMGLGAQSFGIDYLAYNDGAASKKMKQYITSLNHNQIPIQDIYALPERESIAKMISVAFYFGFIDCDAFEKRFNRSLREIFKEEIDFVLEQKLMFFDNNRLTLTNRGSDYINGVIPLFYSESSKIELIERYEKSKAYDDGEKQFLTVYNIESFQRPSLATDIVVLAHDGEKKSVLLIKRGEHPFMNSWALPGGFVRPNESAEDTAARELYEETGLKNTTLSQLQLLSTPKRDPRGWIVSCAFIAQMKKEQLAPRFGDDAIDARLFDIEFKKLMGQNYSIKLINDNLNLSATIQKKVVNLEYGTKVDYEIIDPGDLAFDHAKILMMALDQVTCIV